MAAKEIKGASENQTSQTTSPSMSTGSSSSITMSSVPATASRSDDKLFSIMNRVSVPVMRKGKGGKFVSGDQPIKATLCLAATGSWVNTASTPTVYSGIMTPNGCTEFSVYAQVYEQYSVKRIDAQIWTGEVNAARSVSGTSVATGTPLVAVWANGPQSTTFSFNQLVDSTDSKVLDYLHKSLHHIKHYPKGCYMDIGSSTYDNSMGWQSTMLAASHSWGTFQWATLNQAVTASGIPYAVVYKFDVEFRRRRYNT
jgi:hypothetical protein